MVSGPTSYIVCTLLYLCAYTATAAAEPSSRTFYQSGHIEYGKTDDSYTADLVLYIDDSLDLAMSHAIVDFMQSSPDIQTIYIASGLPSRMLKSWILEQGYIDGIKTNRYPDIFISTNPDHLKTLLDKHMLHEYSSIAGDRLVLMTARGNPKHVSGIKDLSRRDIVQCQPSPESTDMFSGPAGRVVAQSGLLHNLAGGKDCQDCWALPGRIWLTSDYRLRSAKMIAAGQADTGFALASDMRRLEQQHAVAAVEIGNATIDYTVAHLSVSKNKTHARRLMEYLSSSNAQSVYAQYGLIPSNQPLASFKPDIH